MSQAQHKDVPGQPIGTPGLENEPESAYVLRREAGTPRRSLRSWLIGRPLHSADAPHETISKSVGLAVFASDALSSTAYATQEMLPVLAAAGIAAMAYSLPIAVAIVALLAVVTISYQQTIYAYPDGGGAYIVAYDQLGTLPAQVAGAALLTDYVLTVAVSVSSGMAQLGSAFEVLLALRVPIAVAVVFAMMLINLRGVRESGAALAIPSYFFVIMMFVTVGIGLWRYVQGLLGQVSDPPPIEVHGGASAVTLFMLLHAFANGTTALTGVEAISNGITAFKEPRSRNAATTLVAMSLILGTLFLGLTFISRHIVAVPSREETVISQVARTVFGGQGPMYLTTIAATTVILFLAANTAFAGFPRLAAMLAADGFLPRQLTYRGSRLVFSRGIMLLSAVAALLIVLFDANVSQLIPLYAVGVFVSFTLSQLGMARRWWRSAHPDPRRESDESGRPSAIQAGPPDPSWWVKLAINGFGAVCTFVVTLVFAVTKFGDGAWIVLVIMPIMVFAFSQIKQHYNVIARRLSLDDYGAPPRMNRHRVILPVGSVHRGTLKALHYARSLSSDVTAINVARDAVEAERLQRRWDTWGENTRLVILTSPYRLLHEPLLDYIREVAAVRQPNEMITVVVPQFVPDKLWHNALHSQTAQVLRWALLNEPGVVVTDVPYVVGADNELV